MKASGPRKQPVKALTLLGDGVQNTGKKSGVGVEGGDREMRSEAGRARKGSGVRAARWARCTESP